MPTLEEIIANIRSPRKEAAEKRTQSPVLEMFQSQDVFQPQPTIFEQLSLDIGAPTTTREPLQQPGQPQVFTPQPQFEEQVAPQTVGDLVSRLREAKAGPSAGRAVSAGVAFAPEPTKEDTLKLIREQARTIRREFGIPDGLTPYLPYDKQGFFGPVTNEWTTAFGEALTLENMAQAIEAEDEFVYRHVFKNIERTFKALGLPAIPLLDLVRLNPVTSLPLRAFGPRGISDYREILGAARDIFSGDTDIDTGIRKIQDAAHAPPMFFAAAETAATLGVGKAIGVATRAATGRTAAEALAAQTAARPEVQKFTQLINAARPARAETRALVHSIRQQQAARVSGVLERAQGEAGLGAALGQLKGKLPVADFQAPRIGLTQTEINDLYNLVWKLPKSFDKLNTGKALEKTLLGQLPTTGEIALLEKAFGSELAKALLSKRAFSAKAWELSVDAMNLPRALLSSMDISAPFRQGALVGARHPVVFAKTFGTMLKAFTKEKYAIIADDAMRNGEFFDLSQRSGLFHAPISGIAGSLSGREELFISRLASKIPLVRNSERAYITFLNKLRQDVFAQTSRNWQAAGKGSANDYEQLAKWLNYATGRGSLGPVERDAAVLSAAFFSPRLLVSRFQAPAMLLSSSPSVRKEVIASLASFISTGTTILTLMDLSGAAEVTWDPRSSDFGKLRIGSTRIDFWAGYQPIVRYFSQFTTGRRKTTGVGHVVEADRMRLFGRFFQSKLSPQLALGVDIVRGETFVGEELSLEPGSLGEQALQRLVPLFIQDTFEAMREQGALGAALALPAAVGASVQTFTSLRDIQNQVAVERFQEGYEDLNEGQQRIVDNTERVIQAQQRLNDTDTLELRERIGVSVNLWEKRKVGLESELRHKIDSGAVGEPLRQAIQDFKRGRYEASKALFSDEISSAIGGAPPEALEDVQAEKYWSVELEVNARTGEPNYTKYNEEREWILAESEALGVDPMYIIGTGEGTYRGLRFTDPVIRNVVLRYESDQMLLSDYWQADERLRPAIKKQNLPIDMALVEWYGARGVHPEARLRYQQIQQLLSE